MVIRVLNKVVDRINERRKYENRPLITIINEEVEKEKNHSHTDQSNENGTYK